MTGCMWLKKIVFAVAFIGAINWGLWACFQFDLVAWMFHSKTSMGARLVYGIIGLAGLWGFKALFCCNKWCGKCHKMDCSSHGDCHDHYNQPPKSGCCH